MKKKLSVDVIEKTGTAILHLDGQSSLTLYRFPIDAQYRFVWKVAGGIRIPWIQEGNDDEEGMFSDYEFLSPVYEELREAMFAGTPEIFNFDLQNIDNAFAAKIFECIDVMAADAPNPLHWLDEQCVCSPLWQGAYLAHLATSGKKH